MVFEDRSGVELPILGGGARNGMPENTGVAGVDNTANLANNPYLANTPYRELDEDDDTNNEASGYDEIEIVANPAPTDAAQLTVNVD